jgi:hypothetical protein
MQQRSWCALLQAADRTASISLLKDDPRAVFTGPAKAQAAIDFLRELVLRESAQAEASLIAAYGARNSVLVATLTSRDRIPGATLATPRRPA